MRVLLASNDRSFLPSQVEAYSALGWEVATGVDNLFHRAAPYDLVHLHWPEELIGWKPPTVEALDRLDEALRYWRQRAPVVATVHNFLPHRAKEHPLDRQLYGLVYTAADTLGHFSQYSRETVRAAFPDVEMAKHVVHPPFLFTHMRGFAVGRSEARKRLNLKDGEFAALVFGALRERAEFELVKRALDQCRLPNLRILFAGRFDPGTRWTRLRHRARMTLWRRNAPVQVFDGFVSDAETACLFEAADAVLISRFGRHLNSGVMSLAMTLGTPVVAPAYGAYAEHLGGTLNAMYAPRDGRAMADALRVIAGRDRREIFAANAAIAANWGWDKALPAYTHRPDRAVVLQ